jgi:hypothetical protein
MKLELEFVPYELALRMKQLRFDEPCMASRDMGNNHGLIQVPTWQSAFRWFREKYKFYASVVHMNKKNAFYITVYGEEKIEFYFDTYEEAELACLTKLIELVESKTE